ncbi:MAG: hypothetical protein ACR2MG_04920 [Pyrinomonadaceae bacterium]
MSVRYENQRQKPDCQGGLNSKTALADARASAPYIQTLTALGFQVENCSGINIIVTNRETFETVRTRIKIAVTLRRLCPVEWKMEKYLNLIVN